jgi:hypothetical protein
MNVNEAVVISLPQRRDRLLQLMRTLPQPWILPELRIHDGVDPLDDPPAPAWRSGPGAWGCRQAHLQVLRSAWQRGVTSTLVLEDDAAFEPDFADHWNDLRHRVPANWHMIMLGGQHITDPTPIGRYWQRCTNTRRTHAYIIKLTAIPLLMRTWQNAVRHIDHRNVDFQRAANVYAPTRLLVGQAPGLSDITGYTHEASRFWRESVS